MIFNKNFYKQLWLLTFLLFICNCCKEEEETPCNDLVGKWEWIGNGVSTTQYFVFDYKTEFYLEFQTCCLLIKYLGEEVRSKEHYWITDTLVYINNRQYYYTLVYIDDEKYYYFLKRDTLFLENPKNDIFPINVYFKDN